MSDMLLFLLAGVEEVSEPRTNKDLHGLTSPKSTIEYQRQSGALANPIDPDEEEGRDQRIGNCWWFIRPLVRRDGGPPRRVAKLYLPPGATYFGSREGYGLTYTSCQESRKLGGLFRRLAAEMGMDETTIRTALNRGELP